MKKFLIVISLFVFSLSMYAQQEHRKIEIAYVDYNDTGDTSFYNKDIPAVYAGLELVYRFEGEEEWKKVKRDKELMASLQANPVSAAEAKKYKKKRFWGVVTIAGGVTAGVVVATVSPIIGASGIVAAAGTGFFVLDKAQKHFYNAIYLYNESQTEEES